MNGFTDNHSGKGEFRTAGFPAKSYLGKEVHSLFYIEDEAQNVPASTLSKKKPSDFFDILNKQEGEKFDKHVNQIRGEWDRNI